jgi:hypothetical protein
MMLAETFWYSENCDVKNLPTDGGEELTWNEQVLINVKKWQYRGKDFVRVWNLVTDIEGGT